MSDVLDDRLYDGHMEVHYAIASRATSALVSHIHDLKAEVVRLRALPKVELTEHLRSDVEYTRRSLQEFKDGWCRCRVGYLLDAIDSVCPPPPKAPPTDAELADEANLIGCMMAPGDTRSRLLALAEALRARSK
jgi:hypothetical protein